ncbi:EAL domain-containing protein [Bradyrhizobium manausense]|uniref:EAL domain-containing protein n=1 Tax=Bradyrhizobium manausense TaxID=989370 RepID=UPI001BA548A1|nr:EAL domain-containing protein [Bradyrhizobium manausense]MBR0830227.1 EAL domain-containing protein [Bradyrhizobium manausense]
MEGKAISRMFAALSATNEAILRARSEDELHQRVCDAAVLGGKLLGAATFVAKSDGLLHCVALAGADFLAHFPKAVDPAQAQQGLCVIAFRTGRTIATNDYMNDRRMRLYRDAAFRLGVRSAVAIPIRRAGQVCGALCFFLRQTGGLSRHVVGVLERMAENVSFGLDRFGQVEQSEQLAKQNRRLFSAMNNIVSQGVALLDERGRLVMYNERCRQIFGLPPELTTPGTSLRRIAEFIKAEGSTLDEPAGYLQAAREQIAVKGRYECVVRMTDGRSIRVLSEQLRDGGYISLHEDITESLRQQASFRLLFDNNPVPMGVFEYGTWKFIAVNDAAVDLYGYTREEFLERAVTDFAVVADPDAYLKMLEALPLAERDGVIVKHRRADGRVLNVKIFSHALTYDGRPARLAASIDVTDQLRAEREIRRARGFLDAVIENIPMPVVVKAPKQADAQVGDWAYTLLNGAAEKLFGVTREKWIGRTPAEVQSAASVSIISKLDQEALTSGAAVTSEVSSAKLRGSMRTVKSYSTAIRDDRGRAEYLVAVFEDVTEQRRASERIAYFAHHDSLTGLPNRVAFDEFFPRALDASNGCGGELVVMCLDLDGFKDINDQYGHAAGDEVLRGITGRLRAAAEEGAFLARVGGDEFVLLWQNVGGAGKAGELAQRLIAASKTEFDVEGMKLRVGLSIGIAVSPMHGADCKTLLANADIALYQAKNEQRGTIRHFSKAMDSQVREERALRADLQRALEKGELHLHYQPQVDMDREVIGYEALLRWRSAARGDVSPMTFVPLAEETGLIVPIGEWVLREACREAASWSGRTKVAVNISPRQIKGGDLPGLVQRVLVDSGLPASRLELEITESVFIDDFTRALSTLMRLKALGVDIALDDFGTGYSSLSYLHAFPFDRIKVDRSFVADLGTNERSDAIMRAIVTMAKSLGIPVLAEGVETEQQWSWLSELGCDAVQGYLIGRPQPPHAISRGVTRVQAQN